MPFKDLEKKKEFMREWRKNRIDEGYGKWLYRRRKLRFDDAERFRAVLQEIVANDPDRMTHEGQLAHRALEESRQAEEELGRFA